MKRTSKIKSKPSSSIRKGFKYQDLQALRLTLELYIENIDFELLMEEDNQGNLDDIQIFRDNKLLAYQVKLATTKHASYKIIDFIDPKDKNKKRIHIKKFANGWRDLKKKYPKKDIRIILLSNHSEGDDLLDIIKQGQFQQEFIENKKYKDVKIIRKNLKEQTSLEEEEFKDFLSHFHFQLKDKNLNDLEVYIKENLLFTRLNIKNKAIFDTLRRKFEDYAIQKRKAINAEFYKSILGPLESKFYRNFPDILKECIFNENDKDFRRIMQIYVPPEGLNIAFEKLKAHRFLMITGPPHIGKTSTLYKLAYDIKQSHEDIKLILEVDDQSEAILKLISIYIKNSIILFDDIFGKLDFEKKRRAENFEKILKLTQNPNNNFVICTSRVEHLSKAKIETESYFDPEYEFKMKQEGVYSDDALNQILDNHLRYYLHEGTVSEREINIIKKNQINVIKSLRFPHNYQFLIEKNLKNVISGKIDMIKAIECSKHIKKAVKRWFLKIENNEIKHFILTIAIFQNLEEGVLEQIHKGFINLLREHHRIDIIYRPLRLLMKKAEISEYIHYKSNMITFIHPSYYEGIMELLLEEGYIIDYCSIINIILKQVYETQCITINKFINILSSIGSIAPNISIPFLTKLISISDLEVLALVEAAFYRIGIHHPDAILSVIDEYMSNMNELIRKVIILTLLDLGRRYPNIILQFLGKKMSSKDETTLNNIIEVFRKMIVVDLISEKNNIGVFPFLNKKIFSEDEHIRKVIGIIIGYIGLMIPEDP